MVADDGTLGVTCEFCSRRYVFEASEVEEGWRRNSRPLPSCSGLILPEHLSSGRSRHELSGLRALRPEMTERRTDYPRHSAISLRIKASPAANCSSVMYSSG
jgi:hypothetical protein